LELQKPMLWFCIDKVFDSPLESGRQTDLQRAFFMPKFFIAPLYHKSD